MKKLTILIKFRSALKTIVSYAGFAICVAFFSSSLSAGETGIDENFHEKYRNDLTQIENYLNNIKNLSADFSQESEGRLVEGKFFLVRSQESSGKMRVEYSTQPKILIVVNGAVLSYYDIELDEISRLRTNTTPASFLTRPNISFSAKDVEITDIKKTADQIKISVMKKNRKDAGEFRLIFKTNPLQFIKMEIKNDLGQIIAITLSNVDFDSPISEKLFVIRKN